MVQRSQSEANLTLKQQKAVMKSEQKREKQMFKENIAKMNSLVKSLEVTLQESQKSNETAQLDEAKKQNKQLLNVLQQQYSNHELSVSRSQIDVSPSYSTVSMVHLQYKYEELLSSHEGLLKLLEAKVREVRKCYKENEQMNSELKAVKDRIEDLQRNLHMICDKYMKMKQRKERRVSKVRFEKDTIKLAHDKLVHLLHRKCMEQEDNLNEQLGHSTDCLKSLLLNEIRRANKLQYENVILHHQNNYLRAKLRNYIIPQQIK